MTQRIVPNLWCNGTGAEAADFYVSAFGDARILSTVNYPTEGLADFQAPLAGKPLTIELELLDHRFTIINAGPEFRPNAALSFMVNFDPLMYEGGTDAALSALDSLWVALSDGGEVIMELGEYPFSRRYGFIADRYGTTWQLMLSDPEGDPRPHIVPCFLFGAAVQDRAAEAVEYWTELFDDAALGTSERYREPTGPAAQGAVMFCDFTLNGQWFAAMDAGHPIDESFTPGVSLVIMCDGQAEIDKYWAALSKVPEAEQCGWCADQFGVSWQIVPANLEALMQRPGAFEALMDMHKIEIDRF